MFTLKITLLAEKIGNSKKTGNSYRLATVRVGSEMMNIRVDSACPVLSSYIDKEFVGKFSLTGYNLNPNISLVGVESK